MFHLKHFLYFIFICFIFGNPQLNLHYTHWECENENDNPMDFQHNCLRTFDQDIFKDDYLEILYYCMSESPSKFHIDNNDFVLNFTFDELSNQNISSEQLYLWSAPIDIIECYQSYLNELSTLNHSSLANKIFYNCTLPRFGPKCQYQLHYHYPNQTSLNEIINEFYILYEFLVTKNITYIPLTFTCYTHLQCIRGPLPTCLDWTEICNGLIDCIDGGLDEKHCWELEINECQDNEFRCKDGQCIPKSFSHDKNYILGCIDFLYTDRKYTRKDERIQCLEKKKPSIVCEDHKYEFKSWTSNSGWLRNEALAKVFYSSKDPSVTEDCWLAYECLLIYFRGTLDSPCDNFCEQDTCREIINGTCPNILYLPNVPVIFGELYLALLKTDLLPLDQWDNYVSVYLCYNNSHYDDYSIDGTKILLNNMTCVHRIYIRLLWIFPEQRPYQDLIQRLGKEFYKYHLSFEYTTEICSRSNMYQCFHSPKCISKHRLLDLTVDCPHNDDEDFIVVSKTNFTERIKTTYFKCELREEKYIPQTAVRNHRCDCSDNEFPWCEDEDSDIAYIAKNILFQHICDRYNDLLLPINVTGRNETDETECEQWECNNAYTRCNGVWNCFNGMDENGCSSSDLQVNCSTNEYLCVSPHTNKLTCISMNKTNDGAIDCLGATDETMYCLKNKIGVQLSSFFYCRDKLTTKIQCFNVESLCDYYEHCAGGYDEQFCENQTLTNSESYCARTNIRLTSAEHFLCHHYALLERKGIVHFRLQRMNTLEQNQTTNIEKTVVSNSHTIPIPDQYRPHCHHGLDLYVWLNAKNNSRINSCLCPLSYYGDTCQYQNQRISLSMKFEVLPDSWLTLFAIVISLIDDSDERIIHSYEQITYVSIKYCKITFNMNLIYSTRPKNIARKYAVHIDIYEKHSLDYRGSLLFPVVFPFLPVNRLALVINIPRSTDKTQTCSNDQCIHGKCIQYLSNLQNLTFCQCDQGWSGKYCTIQHSCKCANDSLCIGIDANKRSICVCPLSKFGSRCLLTHTICQTNDNSTCQNNGQCLAMDNYLASEQKFLCICPNGFMGDRCEISKKKLTFSFNKHIDLSEQIFIHFIEINSITDPLASTVRSTTFLAIYPGQTSVTIYWLQPFHLVFIDVGNKTYYLSHKQTTYERLTTINKTINPSDRCPHINELFNDSFSQLHLIRRIKYYHLPCQNQSLNLSCFYDDVHFCLCYQFGEKRLTDCFKFDHNMKFNCQGKNLCQYGGQCLQDHPQCPTRSICLCPKCYFGQQCQFSTSGFGISLDAILGYHILPNVNIPQQSAIVQFSVGLTIIFIIIGLINGTLSLLTFKNKTVREVGCGLYLLGSSITTLLTTIIFAFKFFVLLLTQMTIISNISFLSIQCYSTDLLLRVFLNMDQWLNACVATERAVTTVKGASFVKKKSKQAAKYVIPILFLIIIVTCIHDPISRQLIDETKNDDNDEGSVKKIWCIVRYQFGLQVYNNVIHALHFIGPFLINIISAIILIRTKSRQQVNIQYRLNYKEILFKQFKQHKHLLTAPIVLVILGIPRLVLTYISTCMNSTGDAWLFLIGYFISFIPPMLTFVIFVLTSKFYKKEFNKTVKQFRTIVQRRLRLQL